MNQLDLLSNIEARRREIRAELRSIDDSASRGNRGLTADETATLTERRAELEQLERRVDGILTIERRGAELAQSTLGQLAGALPDIGGPGRRHRDKANLTAIDFTEDQIRSLHDEMMSGRTAEATAELRTVTDTTAAPMATITHYQLPPYTKRREPTRVAALMPSSAIQQPSVTYYTTSTGADNAAAVAEGAAKPQSLPAWTPVVATARKIAHYVTVTNEALADYGNFEMVVRNEMLSGLANAENLEILNGSGTPPHLLGLTNTSGMLTYAPGSTEPWYQSLLHAMTLLRNGSAYTEPTDIVLNPADVEVLAKTLTSGSGELLVSPDPQTGLPGRLWGVNITATSQMASGTALVADFDRGTALWEREPARIFVDPYSKSTSNEVNFICEERLAIGTPRPSALCLVTFHA